MTKAFIPSVEKKLQDKQETISKRGFLGDSLAGNMSIHNAMNFHQASTFLLLQSAAVSEEDIIILKDFKTIHCSVYQTVGVYEDQFISPITHKKLHILTYNRMLFDMFTKKGANTHYTEHDAHHEWTFWKDNLHHLLNFFISVPNN